MRSRRAAAVAGLALALPLAACSTTVAGLGHPAVTQPTDGSTSASPSGSGSTSNGLPSGAPSPTASQYPDSSPVVRSYLNARDATYAAPVVTVTGRYTADGPTVAVEGSFGFDAGLGVTAGRCLLTAGGGEGEVRGIGDDTWARAPAAFWTAFGADAGAAAQAADRWVKLSQTVTGVAACNNKVFFLSQFEPEDSHDLRTDAGGGTFSIDDRTSGVTTSIDQNTGRITAIRTSGGDLTFDYRGAAAAVAPPPPADVVTVPGI